MTPFDVHRPRLLAFAFAELANGDIAQFRGRGLIASWIRWATHGVHSHSGMIRVSDSGELDLLEVREFIGGRAVPLLDQVERYPGRIDVFRPRLHVFHQYSTEDAVWMMRRITSQKYGYAGVLRLALQRLPILWRLASVETRDVLHSGRKKAPFCSHAVAIACRSGGVDPVPRKPDHLVTPADLTNSLLFDYVGTLVP